MHGEFSQAVTQMRETLAESVFPDENHRKAALRKILHSSAAGLRGEEIDELVAKLRERFPDRSFETATLARDLERKSTDLEFELEELRAENSALTKRVRDLESLVEGMFSKATHLKGGRISTGGAVVHASRPTEKLAPLFKAMDELLSFAAQQESISKSVDGLISQPVGTAGLPLADLLQRIAQADGDSSAELEQLRTRMRHLGLAPAAMMAGVQQSWKGGTTQILEALDPVKCEESVQGKFPGLRDVAVLKEVKHRFQEFWTRLDDNIAHYYRGTFERVYREKMEER